MYILLHVHASCTCSAAHGHMTHIHMHMLGLQQPPVAYLDDSDQERFKVHASYARSGSEVLSNEKV